MNFELLYAVSNIAVLPAWLLLICAPRWAWTDLIVHRIWIPLLYCAAVVVLFVIKPQSPPDATIATFAGFMRLMTSPYGALMVWVQLIAWDLFIGAWQARDACRRGIHPAWMVVPLLGTFMFGPLGLLVYLIIRHALRRAVSLQETTPQPVTA